MTDLGQRKLREVSDWVKLIASGIIIPIMIYASLTLIQLQKDIIEIKSEIKYYQTQTDYLKQEIKETTNKLHKHLEELQQWKRK